MSSRNNIKYNAEGYYDPTAYGALKEIIEQEKKNKYRPLVFICSPYEGDVETNARKAREYCRFAVEQKAIPIAPHLFFPQFMNKDKPEDRKLGLFFGRVLLDKCSEIWIFSKTISRSMELDLKRAERRNMVIRHFNEECIEVSQVFNGKTYSKKIKKDVAL